MTTAVMHGERADGASTIETKKLLWAAPAAGALSVAGNLLVYGAAQVAGLPLGVAPQPDAPIAPLPLVPVLVSSFAPAIVAALLLAVLARVTARAATIFAIVAAVFLVLSFVPVATAPMDGVATRLVLGVMHVVSAAAIAGGLLRFTAATPR